MPSLITTAPATLTRLPALALEPNRIIIGIYIQFIDSAGGWRYHEGKRPVPLDHEILGLCTRRACQRWVDSRPEIIAEVPGGSPLPSIDDLNDQIPEEEWPIGLSGKREPPWKREFILHGLDLHDLVTITYANNTIGAIRAIESLEDAWSWARALFGDDVRPVITLSQTEFATAYGVRQRPVFKVESWRVFRDGGLRAVSTNTPVLASPQPRPPGETLADEIPY
jgi:hypothetical protein